MNIRPGIYELRRMHFLNESAIVDALQDDEKQFLDKKIVEIAKNQSMQGTYYKEYTDAYRNSAKKMQGYKEKGSNPIRLANTCQDFEKVCNRLWWCIQYWEEAIDAFRNRAEELYLERNKSWFNAQMQEERKRIAAEEERKRKFEEDVQNTNTEEYLPSKRDWDKMIDYRNRKSDPTRIANSCKDNNKIVARYIIARLIGWGEAVDAFKNRIKELNILSDAQLEAYIRKYNTESVPVEYQALIDDLSVNDLKGGFAKLNKETMEEKLPEKLVRWLDNNTDIEEYIVTKPEDKQKIKYQIGHGRNSFYHEAKYPVYNIHITMFNGEEFDVLFIMKDGQYYSDTFIFNSYSRETLENYCYYLQSLLDKRK